MAKFRQPLWESVLKLSSVVVRHLPHSRAAGAGAGGAVQRRHRAADKQQRRCWHHGCR